MGIAKAASAERKRKSLTQTSWRPSRKQMARPEGQQLRGACVVSENQFARGMILKVSNPIRNESNQCACPNLSFNAFPSFISPLGIR
jgi:hypothetical protein